jgi:hypothetical protein
MYYKLSFIVAIGLIIASCGDPGVVYENDMYEPQISIQGYLFPHKQVDKIYIFRNFDATKNIPFLPISDADVTITDLENETIHPLSFVDSAGYYRYNGSDLEIDYNKSYRLDVSATITSSYYAKELKASSITTIPGEGLDNLTINHNSLSYRQKDPDGNVINFNIEFDRSPGTNIYLISILSLDGDVSNFIYDNPYEDASEDDVRDNLWDYRSNHDWIQDTPLTVGRTNTDIFWFNLSFYGQYRVVVYAVDKNYSDFLRTYNDVQEFDGNLHEPVFHIEGDGIGIFGSAVTDTIYFEVTH